MIRLRMFCEGIFIFKGWWEVEGIWIGELGMRWEEIGGLYFKEFYIGYIKEFGFCFNKKKYYVVLKYLFRFIRGFFVFLFVS